VADPRTHGGVDRADGAAARTDVGTDAYRPPFTIREVRPDEYEALGDLTVRAYAAIPGETDDGYHPYLRDVASRAEWIPVLVAVDGEGRLLGGVSYVSGPGTPYSESEQPGEAGFRTLAVDPIATGRGVGRALAQACIDRARLDGRTGVAIYTRPAMLAAHGLYGSLGFRREPSRDWEFEPGEWLWSFVLRFEPET
jgi:ribosomal protein S18 acetylase RimI-like enzyme